MNYDSYISGVALAAVALINVVTPGRRNGREVVVPRGQALAEAVTGALRAESARPVEPVSIGDAEALTEWALRLRAVVERADEGRIDQACQDLNGVLAAACAVPTLARHHGEPWHLHFHRVGAGPVGSWAAGMATGLAMVLGTPAIQRLGLCQAPACDRVYLDISRNGSRRFCGTPCQNRVKAAAYRARAQSAG